MDKFMKDKIRNTISNLGALSEKTVLEVPELKFIRVDYKDPQEYPVVDDSWQTLKRHERIHGCDDHFWLYTKIKTPKVQENQQLYLKMITSGNGGWDADNPQGLIYLNGEITQGIDKNHRRVMLEADREYEVMLYFYMGMAENRLEVMMNVLTIDTDLEELYYDMKVPYDTMLCYDKDDYNSIVIAKYLEQACNLIDFRDTKSDEFYKSVKVAQKYLKEEFYEKECGNSNVIVNYIGHTHIDVACKEHFPQFLP